MQPAGKMQPAGGGDSGTNARLAGAGVSSAATTTAATGHTRVYIIIYMYSTIHISRTLVGGYIP